jgi:hypothetical protein
MTTACLTEAEHATLLALLEERRRLLKRRKRARHIASRKALTLAQKVEQDRKFGDRLAELNDQIYQLTKRGGETI